MFGFVFDCVHVFACVFDCIVVAVVVVVVGGGGGNCCCLHVCLIACFSVSRDCGCCFVIAHCVFVHAAPFVVYCLLLCVVAVVCLCLLFVACC